MQKKINNFPDGKLICSRNGNGYKWYQSDGHTKIYIPKKEKGLAEQLALKKFFSEIAAYLSHEKMSLEFYLRHHSKNPKKIEDFLINSPGYKELLTPFFTPKNQILNDWAHDSYNRNPKYPEHLIHKSASGNMVRSKSEAMIDLYLYTNQIPFRYECALQLGDSILFPNFTIRHPETGDFYYWEHFGLMDNCEYVQHTFSKLELYASYGLIPSIQLITTYETKDNPLSFETIDQIVSHYFL